MHACIYGSMRQFCVMYGNDIFRVLEKAFIHRKVQFLTMYGALKVYLCVIFDDRFQSIYKLCERSKIRT